MTQYMASHSPKLAWLASFCGRLCIDLKRKLLVFCNAPVTVWMVECFLLTLGFRVVAIRSMHTPAEREETRRAFNDPANASQVLVTSIEVSAASINLQNACSEVVFVDVPPSCSKMLQAFSRTYRLGQPQLRCSQEDAYSMMVHVFCQLNDATIK